MEKLTKQQIVLVTLLVSFVTSIATGIVTVALMDQAPPGVTQTINRVVERTIEKVVTEPATNNNAAAVVTRETIVVKEDDKIVESVAKNKDSLVRIYTKPEGDTPTVFVGLGTIVTKEGLIVTGDVFSDITGRYVISTNDNVYYDVQVLPKKDKGQFYFLKVVQDDKKPVTFAPVTFTDSNNLKLGQTVIAWGGATQNAVSTGIVSSLMTADGSVTAVATSSTASTTTPVREVLAISTNINLADSISGGPLLNLYGEVVGLRVSSNISSQYNFLPANILKPEITSYAPVQ